MAALAVFIGYLVAGKIFALDLQVFFAALSAFLICGAGQAINDFFDLEIDKKIRPKKILPSKKMAPKTALIYSVILFLAGNFFALLINFHTAAIALSASTLLILYSAFIQKEKFFGNIVVSLSTALTLVFGAAILQKYETAALLAASAFFASIGREIIKDVEDKKADRGAKKSVPMVLSKKHTNAAVLLSYTLAVLIALFVWAIKLIENFYYPVLILVSAIIFAKSFLLLTNDDAKKAQLFSKIAMLVSLFAFLTGAF
ncbi:MAG: geranylgeranylglycerol-phosphate geranylgeranyltransferase [Candidatus Diapherotrites archaeon]|nr:geranylgeranylglycerol-phosphate geranylgeranyltransferase [Candidatus Diapherotrites archaeon]